MGEEKEGSDRRRGFDLRNVAVIAVGLAIAVVTGFGMSVFLKQKREELLASEAVNEPREVDGMFIDAGDADLVIKGRKVYEANCASCHGYSLEGQPNWQQRGPDGILPAPPHDENGHTWHHPDAILFATVKLGGQTFMPQGVKSGMPAYGDILSEREILASLAYIKSRWPSKIRRRQEMRTNQSG